MIRKFQDADINKVAKIWLDTNVSAHDFIPTQYWKSNYELVKGMLPQAEVYVYAEDSSQEDYMNSLQTASGCQNMMDYYGALCHSREHPILTTYRKEILLEEGEMEALFGEHDFGSFLQEGMGESFSVFDMQGGTCLVWSLRAYAVNAGAYRQLGLKAVEGEGFTEESLSIRSAE